MVETRLMSAEGKMLTEEKIKMGHGFSYVHQMNLSAFETGTYIVLVTHKTGKLTTEKLVIAK